MLDILEKVVAGLCGVFVLLTLGVYAFFKLPSPVPSGFLPPVYETPEPAGKSAPAETPSASSVDPEIQKLAEKLSLQERKATVKELVDNRKRLTVPAQTFEVLSAEANWLPNLKTAKSQPLPTKNGNTRLRIYDIQPNSILLKLGFEENDVVELIGGEIVEFEKSQSTKYYEMAEAAKKALAAGKAISVVVTRKGRLVPLEFRLERK